MIYFSIEYLLYSGIEWELANVILDKNKFNFWFTINHRYFNCIFQQLKKTNCLKFTTDLIWTWALWYPKRQLYQLCHIHCPDEILFLGT